MHLRKASPTFTGRVLNLANLVLYDDEALGAAASGARLRSAYSIISNDDAINIPVEVQLAQNLTVRGGNSVEGLDGVEDHSIEFSGPVIQTNTRSWVNLLPYDFVADTGKTLTLSGPQYPLQGGTNEDADRIYTIEGSGKTIVSGGIHNRPPDGTNPGDGHFRVRGTGVIVVDFDESNTSDSASDFDGFAWVEGSNLHFAQNSDMGNNDFVSSGGAVGVDSGVVGNSTFLNKLNNSLDPTNDISAGFVKFNSNVQTVFDIYDDGGLMLASDEYDENLDFNSGSLANAANMSLAAHEGGSTYTGTITPSTSVYVNPDTYMLGGGSGTLTLPNANQLTGARDLLVNNGGEVQLTTTNDFTGTTRIGIRDDSVLTVTALEDGGVASSIGSSSSDAENLVVQGGTLKYEGAVTDTDRLFTVGTVGGTIDASGSGELVFSNTGDLAIDTAEDRQGIMKPAAAAGSYDNEIYGVPDWYNATYGRTLFLTDDLVVGMAVRDLQGNTPPELVDDDSVLEITAVSGSHVVKVGEKDLDADNDSDTNPPDAWDGITGLTHIHPIQFGPAPARMLTLAGTNTGNNTLAPLSPGRGRPG